MPKPNYTAKNTELLKDVDLGAWMGGIELRLLAIEQAIEGGHAGPWQEGDAVRYAGRPGTVVVEVDGVAVVQWRDGLQENVLSGDLVQG